MTPGQLHILQHSLGLDEYGQGTLYRNHYVTEPGCDGYDDCRALVELGFMREHKPRELTGNMPCFTVTDQGIAEAIRQSPKPSKLTRSQKRYREWLRIADVCDLSFGEWLKRRAA